MVNLGGYREKLKEIYEYARENDISEDEVDKILQNSFHVLEKRRKKHGLSLCMKSVVITLFTIIICFMYFDQKFLAVMLLRNLQTSIYPGLKLVRNVAVPIIQHYPSLSGTLFAYFKCMLLISLAIKIRPYTPSIIIYI